MRIGEWPYLSAADDESADRGSMLQQRHSQYGPDSLPLNGGPDIWPLIRPLGEDVVNVNSLSGECGAAACRTASDWATTATGEAPDVTVAGDVLEGVAVDLIERRVLSLAETRCTF